MSGDFADWTASLLSLGASTTPDLWGGPMVELPESLVPPAPSSSALPGGDASPGRGWWRDGRGIWHYSPPVATMDTGAPTLRRKRGSNPWHAPLPQKAGDPGALGRNANPWNERSPLAPAPQEAGDPALRVGASRVDPSAGHLLFLATDIPDQPAEWRYFASTPPGNAGAREALEWMEWTLRVRVTGRAWGRVQVVALPTNGDPGVYLFATPGDGRVKWRYFRSNHQPSWSLLDAPDADVGSPLSAIGGGISEGATVGGAVATGLGLAGSVATTGLAATLGSALTTGVAATAASGAAAAGSAIGLGAALGNAIPIPGIGAAIGAAVGAMVAAGEAIADATKDTFHPTPEVAEDWLWMFRVAPVLVFLNVDKSVTPASAARLVRYLRIVSGEVPRGYLGNTGELYNPVSNDSCSNPYMCRPDPAEPLTDEAVLARYFTNLSVAATRDGRQIWSLPVVDYARFAPSEIRTPAEAQAALRFLARHFNAIADWSEVTGNRALINAEMLAVKELAAGRRPWSLNPWHAPPPARHPLALARAQGLPNTAPAS